jgi:hypothetical protein
MGRRGKNRKEHGDQLRAEMQANTSDVLGGWRLLWFHQMTRKSQARCSFAFTVSRIALIAALTLTPEAEAQVTTLSYEGTLRILHRDAEEPWTFRS